MPDDDVTDPRVPDPGCALPMSTAAGDRRASMLERMTGILDVFDGPQARAQSGEIAAAARLPRSTTHRILDELIQLGWLVRTTQGYGLGPRVLGFAGSGDQLALRAAAAPLLQVLHEETGIVAHLAVAAGANVVVVDKVGGRVVNTVPTQVGGRAPIHTTALGKAILARYPVEDVDQLLPEVLDKRTIHTIPTRLGLHRELHQIRRREWLAYSDEEASVGICCAATSFDCPDGSQAAIAVSGRAALHHLERVGPLVREAARRVAARISNGGPPGVQEEMEHSATATADALLIRLLNSINGDDWI